MADYWTQFACLLDVGNEDNARRAEEIRGELAAELYRQEGGYLGFEMQVDYLYGPGVLWIYSADYGEPEHVIAFVLRCAEALDLQGVWGFTWGHSCSRPRLDAFGGGAHVLDLGNCKTIADLDCGAWLNEHIDARNTVGKADEEAVP